MIQSVLIVGRVPVISDNRFQSFIRAKCIKYAQFVPIFKTIGDLLEIEGILFNFIHRQRMNVGLTVPLGQN